MTFNRLNAFVVSVFLAGLICSGTSWAGVYTYTASGFAKTITNCPDIARDVGSRMAQTAGVTILRTQCEAEYNMWDVLVQYSADVPVTITSSVAHGSAESGGEFKTSAACEADLSREIGLFRDNTGLEPFISYCELGYDGDDLPWQARVEAAGKGVKTAHLGTMLLYGKVTAGQDLMQQIATGLQTFGASVASVKFHGGLPGWIGARYYAAQPIPFDNPTILMPDANYCGARLADVRAAFAAAQRQPLGLACSTFMSPGSEIDILQVRDAGLDIIQAIDTFAKVTDCEAALSSLVTAYQAAQAPIVGAVCGRKTTDGISQPGFSAYLFQASR